ncbi:hypothetical protein WN48_07204 [Eufriesea mexicana]|uniref:Uncharacterized protein n=1 Tax=Eufriesea mexicana TaxID=516756 RepID=A0A310SRL3_9HYME|nr:hypothetical protein WN48_07204 [Eufriesea mexicana]
MYTCYYARMHGWIGAYKRIPHAYRKVHRFFKTLLKFCFGNTCNDLQSFYRTNGKCMKIRVVEFL